MFPSDFCTLPRNWSCLNREGRVSRQKQRHKQSMGGDHLGLWSWSDVSVVHLIQDIPLQCITCHFTATLYYTITSMTTHWLRWLHSKTTACILTALVILSIGSRAIAVQHNSYLPFLPQSINQPTCLLFSINQPIIYI